MVSVRFLRDSLVVARVWSGFKARGLNIIIVAIRNEDQSLVVRDTTWQLNIPNLYCLSSLIRERVRRRREYYLSFKTKELDSLQFTYILGTY